MFLLGLALLIIGFITGIYIIWIAGVVLFVLGLVFLVLTSMGRIGGGRSYHYW